MFHFKSHIPSGNMAGNGTKHWRCSFPIENGDFPASYVSLPEGSLLECTQTFHPHWWFLQAQCWFLKEGFVTRRLNLGQRGDLSHIVTWSGDGFVFSWPNFQPQKHYPSLKLTFSPLKRDGSETILSFWGNRPIFRGYVSVSFREGDLFCGGRRDFWVESACMKLLAMFAGWMFVFWPWFCWLLPSKIEWDRIPTDP